MSVARRILRGARVRRSRFPARSVGRVPELRHGPRIRAATRAYELHVSRVRRVTTLAKFAQWRPPARRQDRGGGMTRQWPVSPARAQAAHATLMRRVIKRRPQSGGKIVYSPPRLLTERRSIPGPAYRIGVLRSAAVYNRPAERSCQTQKRIGEESIDGTRPRGVPQRRRRDGSTRQRNIAAGRTRRYLQEARYVRETPKREARAAPERLSGGPCVTRPRVSV